MWIEWACWGGGLLSIAVLIGLVKRALNFGTFLRMELKGSNPKAVCCSGHSSRISVIIPSRNEERFIERSARHVLSSQYSHLELILVDDRSQDRTAKVMEHLAKEDPRVSVISVRELPAGWTGKAHALWQGGRLSSGDILVFTDADSVFSPSALSTTLDYFISNDLAMLSLAPGFVVRGFIEDVIHPFLAMGLLFFYPLKDVSDASKPAALASGCYIMITKQAYEAIGGWAAFRDEITEDIAMSKAMKAHGLKLATLRGEDLVQTKPFENLSELFHFWKRSYYGGLGRNPWKTLRLTLIFLLLSTIIVSCPMSGILWLVRGLSSGASFMFASSLLVALAVVVPHGIFLARYGGKLSYSLAAPVGVVFAAYVAASTLRSLIFGNGIRWRGMIYK
jgi:chlorobactene glucosyltransferase